MLYDTIRFPQGNYPVELAGALKKINEASVKMWPKGEESKKYEVLHSLYWQVNIELIALFLDRDNVERFEIDDKYVEWLDMGAVSDRLCPALKEEYLYEKGGRKEEFFNILYFSGLLSFLHDEVLRLAVKEELLKKVDKAKRKLDAFPVYRQRYLKKRDDFLATYPETSHVIDISKEIDESLPRYHEIKSKIELSKRITMEERREYVRLTEKITALREERTRAQLAINNESLQRRLMQLDREMEDVFRFREKAQEELNKAELEYKEYKSFRRNLSYYAVLQKIKDKVKYQRSIIELAGKRSQLKQCSVLTSLNNIISPNDILDSFYMAVEMDRILIDHLANDRSKVPDFVIAPGIGDGVYDHEHNVFVIPLRYLRSPIQSIATVLIEWHIDIPSGKSLKDSYLRLSKCRSISSSIKFREMIVKDYVGWISRESKGYSVLDTETKEWFENNFAPTMFSFRPGKHIKTYIMPVSEIRQYLNEVKRNGEFKIFEFNNQFKIALAYTRIHKWKEASFYFSEAYELNKKSHEACYNLALSLFRSGSKKAAVKKWEEYFALDKSSFWVMRVRKFLKRGM